MGGIWGGETTLEYARQFTDSLSSFILIIIIIGIFFIIYFLYNRGFFHKGKSDLEPSLNILTDDEILKYAPKSRAARKIKSKRSGNIFDKL